MTHEYKIYGASDDLIEIEGHESEEFYANYDEPTYVTLGETKLEVVYDSDGIWRIRIDELGIKDSEMTFGVETSTAQSHREYSELVAVYTSVENVERHGEYE